MSQHVTRTARTLATMLLVGAGAASLGAQTATVSDANRPAVTATSPAALKQLDPADLAFWKNVRFTALSNDGKWFAYQLTPNEGDAEVVVRPTAEGEERRFKIGEPPPPAGGFGGGGNTSVKGTFTNRLGDEIDAMWVKASGQDLATIEPAGFTGVDLGYLRRLRALVTLDDDAMANEMRGHLLDARSATPSIETAARPIVGPLAVYHVTEPPVNANDARAPAERSTT